MSHLARELGMHLAWIERQAQDLQDEVKELVNEGNVLMNGETWDEEQTIVIYYAIEDWLDTCDRSIALATSQVIEFRRHLARARTAER